MSTRRPVLVERAALVGLVTGGARRVDAEHSLEELGGLAEAAGARVVLRVLQDRARPDSATFLGSGKVEVLAHAAAEADADLVIFDNELSPAQLRELNKRLDRKVVDRTQLILDIFARRARTREGKLQVELAQLKYLLPRLVGSSEALSRLGGGIGTRGPGETKLEADRRRIRVRMKTLQDEIDVVRRRRTQLRERRQKVDVPTIALVGYTNAGKTTLFNRLTRSDAEASNALFVTLDPLVRRVALPDRRELLLSDTVGFIDRLPHTLVAAFRATLEETADADLVLHVIDAANPERERHMAAVSRVLEEVGALVVPRVEVYNKVDQLSPDERRRLQEADPSAFLISAVTGEGCDELLESVASRLALDQERVTVELDLADPVQVERLAWIYRHATVHSHATIGDRATLQADVPRRLLPMIGLATPTAPRARVKRLGFPSVFLCFCVSVGALFSACAPKAEPVVVGVPRHTDFMFPAPPAGTPPALAASLDRGWQYLQLDDFRNAEREFATALKAQPTFHPVETAMGYLAVARGSEKDAVTRFDKALQTDPAYVPALVGKGRALLELERVPEALASFEAALAKDPSLTELRSRVEVLRFRSTQDTLARAKAAADAQRWDVAKAAYLQAIAASPDSAFLYRELASVEQRASQLPEALEHYNKAVALDPSDARSLAALGTIVEGQGDVLAALDYYERARAIDLGEVPDSVVARLRARAALLKLPAEYRAIPASAAITRGEFAAVIGIRLEAVVASVRPRQAIITDIRRHWAQQWITAVVRAGIMDPLANYEFQSGQRIRRGDVAEIVARTLGLIATQKPEAARRWTGVRVHVTDVPAGHLSYPAVSVAVASGVMPLVNGGFGVLQSVSGAEAFEIVGRLEALARP